MGMEHGNAPKKLALVVDDDMNLRKIICLFLQHSHYDTIEGKNGEEAITLAREHKPDLIILDVMMPVVDGFTACKEIKDSPITRDIPIVMCTARNRKEDLVAAIKGGADDYIVKPFTKDTLLQKIDKVVNEKTRRITTMLKSADRRKGSRMSVSWSLSWGKKEGENIAPVYKSRVQNISEQGFAFEFNRCDICTGYLQASVHTDCLFKPHAINSPDSPPLDFVLSISRDIIVEAQGKIIHIYQPPNSPKTEKIGVTFTYLSDKDRDIVRKYIAGTLMV